MAYLYNPCQPCCEDPCPDFNVEGRVSGCAPYGSDLAPTTWRVEFSPSTGGMQSLCPNLIFNSFFPNFGLPWVGSCTWRKGFTCQSVLGDVQITWTLEVSSFDPGGVTLSLTGAQNSSGQPITLVFDNRQEFQPVSTNRLALKAQLNLDEDLPTNQKVCLIPRQPETCCAGGQPPDRFEVVTAGIHCPPASPFCFDCFCEMYNRVWTLDKFGIDTVEVCQWRSAVEHVDDCIPATRFQNSARLTIVRAAGTANLTYTLSIGSFFPGAPGDAAAYRSTVTDSVGCDSSQALTLQNNPDCDGWPANVTLVPV